MSFFSKIGLSVMLMFGVFATEAFAARAICVAKAGNNRVAERTRARVVRHVEGRRVPRRFARPKVKQACRQALRQCNQIKRNVARRARNNGNYRRARRFRNATCTTRRAIVRNNRRVLHRYHGLEGRTQIGGRF